MTEFDETMGTEAAALVTEFGRPITYITNPSADYNPATGKNVRIGIDQLTIQSSPPFAYENRWIDGDRIRANDCYVILARELIAFVPKKGAVIAIDASKFEVISVSPLYSGMLIAAFILQLRA